MLLLFLLYFLNILTGVFMQLLKTLAFILLFPTLLLADHAAVGTRPMSEEAATQVEAQKKQDEAADVEAPLETQGYDRYPPVFYSNSHHWLSAVVVLDNNEYTLEFEDGSVWKISSYDGVKALNWKSNDPLTVTQNNRWFSRHNYRIVNKANGTSVEANLFLGPVLGGEFSRFIIGIDHDRREVLLNDNSHWDISYLDSSIFNDWALNDYVIIGTNSNTSFWDSSSDSLLINVNMNNCVRAKQF